MSRRRTRKKIVETVEAIEKPLRYFVELTGPDGQVVSAEGRVEPRRGMAAYHRAAMLLEYGGYAEEVTGVRLVDREAGTTLVSTE